MREITLEKKVYANTQYAIDALAWATNRRGHNEWAGNDVVGDIYAYLVRNNVRLEVPTWRGDSVMEVDKPALRRAIELLIDSGYARSKRSDGGRRIVSFSFHGDVVLTGHTIERETAAPEAAQQEVEFVDDERPAFPAQPVAPELPMPELPFKPYRHNDLLELLRQWQKKDAEGHADYIDRLIDTLTIVLDG